MPTLYLVPTPLGDPDDITLRALRILREASAVAGDDFGAARRLLDAHGITTPIIAYEAVPEALNAGNVALIRSGGTPGIGDAAQAVVRGAIERGIRVEPLPGADAAITALVLSGLPTEAFVYIGKMQDDLSGYANEQDTLVFALDDAAMLPKLLEAFGDRRACLVHADQAVFRGLLRDTLPDAPANVYPAMLVVAGAEPEPEAAWDEARVRAVLRERLDAGEPLKLAAKAVAAQAGWDRRTVYALGVEMKE
jgi:16S rRNA (cytidine1402-2'-O)-methyltransferase